MRRLWHLIEIRVQKLEFRQVGDKAFKLEKLLEPTTKVGCNYEPCIFPKEDALHPTSWTTVVASTLVVKACPSYLPPFGQHNFLYWALMKKKYIFIKFVHPPTFIENSNQSSENWERNSLSEISNVSTGDNCSLEDKIYLLGIQK